MSKILYEKPDIANYGGGSGVHSREQQTPLGEVRLVHWTLSAGKCTELSIFAHGVYAIAGFPEIRLDGHVEAAEDVLKLYLEWLVRLGGAGVVADIALQAHRLGREEGAEVARLRVRQALGLS